MGLILDSSIVVAAERRERFIQDLLSHVEVVSYTRNTAMLAGRLDGEQRSRGVTIPSVDLLIGATALEHGYSVATVNVRHLQLIPGLEILRLAWTIRTIEGLQWREERKSGEYFGEAGGGAYPG